MTTQHTPGPWEQAGNGVIHHWNQNGRGGTLIGEVYGPMGHEDVQANARLIAAAPLMLEALREAVRSLTYAADVLEAPSASTFRDNIANAQAAIRAATGEDA